MQQTGSSFSSSLFALGLGLAVLVAGASGQEDTPAASKSQAWLMRRLNSPPSQREPIAKPSLVQTRSKDLAVLAHRDEESKAAAAADTTKKDIPGYPGSIDPMKVEEADVDRTEYKEDWNQEWKLGAPRKPSTTS